jgi:hypothetical protein
LVNQEVKVLLLLKNLYKKKTGEDWKPPVEGTPKEKKVEEQKVVASKPPG